MEKGGQKPRNADRQPLEAEKGKGKYSLLDLPTSYSTLVTPLPLSAETSVRRLTLEP
jgi:hypothetical protein